MIQYHDMPRVRLRVQCSDVINFYINLEDNLKLGQYIDKTSGKVVKILLLGVELMGCQEV